MRHGSFNIPMVTTDPRLDRSERKATQAVPFSHRMCLTAPLHAMITATIVALLDPSGPVAIIRGVAGGVISALYGILGRRPRPHVGVEGREVLAPAVAYRNPAPAVAVISNRLGVVASRFHTGPYAPFSRLAQSVRHLTLAHHFSLDAAATCRPAVSKTPRLRDRCPSAVALATPRAGSRSDQAHIFQNEQLAKSKPRYVSGRWWHIANYTPIVASGAI